MLSKSIFQVIAIVAIMSLVFVGYIFGQSENDFEIIQNAQGGITITNYIGAMKHVVIPSTIEGIQVTEIGYSAFQNKGLLTVIFPDTVVSIAGSAFRQNYLTEISFGSGLERIGTDAFGQNPTLTKIIIPDNVSEIGVSAFADCGLTEVTFGRNLQTIDYYAFSNNRLTSVILPDNIKQVGVGAFSENPITSVVIPSSLSSASQDNSLLGDLIDQRHLVGGSGGFIQIRQAYSPAFNSNNINSITLPAQMDEGVVRSNFGQAFADFYISQGRRAGTYSFTGRIWTLR